MTSLAVTHLSNILMHLRVLYTIYFAFHLFSFLCMDILRWMALHLNPMESGQASHPLNFVRRSRIYCSCDNFMLPVGPFLSIFIPNMLLAGPKSFIWNWLISLFLILHNSLMSPDYKYIIYINNDYYSIILRGINVDARIYIGFMHTYNSQEIIPFVVPGLPVLNRTKAFWVHIPYFLLLF